MCHLGNGAGGMTLAEAGQVACVLYVAILENALPILENALPLLEMNLIAAPGIGRIKEILRRA